MRVAAAGGQPPGDVILCLLSDEEAGSDLGANYLVTEHPELFTDVRYALGEFGGFTMALAGRCFYPIMVAEKQVCWTLARIRGPAGHGSLAVRGGASGKLGQLLRRLDRRRLPVHVTPVARSMVEAIAAELPAAMALPLRGLLQPALSDRLLDLLGDRGSFFDPLLHNTANANIISAGEKINVVPGEASVQLDCRLLPGFGPEQLFAELRALSGLELELEVIRYDPITAVPDLGLFDTLAGVLREHDASARPVPMLLPAATDGRFFARLGIQTYGFLPMPLPAELHFMRLIHAENERVPVEAIEFGTSAIARVLERF
jgi:acetylornithine deacetylase/succinyl-diaminopimelate desuccinylase-like protein